jgi:outer membrane lipoprotein-sorting protein
VIKRPLEEMQILIRVNKLTVNMPLADDKFELRIPEGTTVHKLD